MGLALEVGYLADLLVNDEEGAADFRDDLGRLNRALLAAGLKEHQEPTACPVYSASIGSYAVIHYLRRVAAHLALGGTIPDPGVKGEARDDVLEERYSAVDEDPPGFLSRLFRRRRRTRFDHLINHSDAEGYYVPQDFPSVLYPDPSLEISGEMIGSTYELLRELEELAGFLELPLNLDPEAEEVWSACEMETQGEGELKWQRYGLESWACLHLHRAAQHSIAQKALIVFC